MDDGRPFRAPRSADRRPPVDRPEPTSRQPEEPQTVQRVATPPTRAAKEQKPPKRSLWVTLAVIAAIILLGVVGWFAWTNMQNNGTAIDESKYQSVFFTNGNVYFGKLQSFNNEYYKMTSVYYPQTQTNSKAGATEQTQATTDQSKITLLKLSDAIHGPEDEMMIAKDQVLFYQNLKTDSKVTQLIKGQGGAN